MNTPLLVTEERVTMGGERRTRIKVKERLAIEHGSNQILNVQAGTLGTVMKRGDNSWNVAFSGGKFNVDVTGNNLGKLEPVDVEILRPLSMIEAATKIGFFFDLWQTNRREAVRCLRKPMQNPMRGAFLPQEPDEENYRRSFTAPEIAQTVVGGLRLEQLEQTSWLIPVGVCLCCSSGFQGYCLLLLKDPCAHQGDHEWTQCGSFVAAHYPLVGFFFSMACFMGAMLSFQVWGHIHAKPFLKGERWWKCRNLLVVHIYDKLALGELPTVTGHSQEILICGFIAIILPFATVALFMLDVGIFAFGKIAASFFLVCGNALLGEAGSMRSIRERRVLEIAKSSKDEAAIDMDDVELGALLDKFLNHTPSHDTIVMDCSLFVLLANLITSCDPESIRLRRFVVRQGYAVVSNAEKEFASGQDLQERWSGEITELKDVIVDIAAAQCDVIGGEQPNARWVRNGWPLPWHLAVRPDAAAVIQFGLQALGMEPGSSAFAPGPMVPPHWENWEATCRAERYFNIARKAQADVDQKSDVLVRLVKLGSFSDDDAELLGALVSAGAQVNDNEGNGGACRALFFCIQKDLPSSVQLLIQKKASLENTYKMGQGYETPLAFATRMGRSRIVEVLSESASKR